MDKPTKKKKTKKPKKAKRKKPLTHGELIERLRKRYPLPEWVTLDEVQPGVGFDVPRRADMLALSTWASRGLRLLGFELKSSRADVLRELGDSTKAEATAKYCDRWYLVCGRADLCHKDELPPKWGLIVPHGSGLKLVSSADKLKPVEWPRGFVAMLLRRAAGESIPQQERRQAFEEGRKAGMKAAAYADNRYKELEARVLAFSKESGINLSVYTGHERMAETGRMVNLMLNGGPEGYRRRLEVLAEQARKTADELTDALADPCPNCGQPPSAGCDCEGWV